MISGRLQDDFVDYRGNTSVFYFGGLTMHLRRAFLASIVVSAGIASTAQAQLPIPVPVPSSNSKNLQRLPNDQIEGTIFEYRGTFKSSKPGDQPLELDGKFRLEGSAIFDVGGTVKAPSQADAEKVKNKILGGKGGELRLPGAPQQKRLGQYQRISGNRLRLDFDDKESLNGTMLLSKKKNTDDVWIGTYSEKQGTTAARVWQVQVRPIED